MRRRHSRYNRGLMRRSAAIVALALLCLLIVILARPHAAGGPEHVAAPSPVRIAAVPRPAGAPWSASSRKELRRAIASALQPALSSAQAWSCIVLADDGSVLYSDRAGTAVVPASAQKLIVADAALTLLGPAFRFDTLFAAEQPARGGAVPGDLWFIGSGDPSFRSSDLARGVETLRKDGVEKIEGRVAVDGSAIAGEEINAAWDADDANEGFMSAVSGMSLDEDTVEFHVTGTQAGRAADVYVNPPSPAVDYSGEVITSDTDDAIVAATAQPNHFRLGGSIPPGVRETFYVPVHGLPHYTGAVLTHALKNAGIAVVSPPVTGTAPIDVTALWDHRSAPLPSLVRHMLVHSDNHYAEQLMRTIGGASGAAADDADGIAAERSVLRAQRVPTPGLHLTDGSGLAQENRVAAVTLAGILHYAEMQPQGNALYLLLPRGGQGTLEMYRFGAAAGRVRAKSGHLADASSLAGYVRTMLHGRAVFAFMINGSHGDADQAIVSAVERIASQ